MAQTKKSDDCPPCTFFGAVGELQDMCGVLAKKGAPLKCDILGEQAEKEDLPLKSFMEQVREQAKKLGFPRMEKSVTELEKFVADHISRQARGEKLPDE